MESVIHAANSEVVTVLDFSVTRNAPGIKVILRQYAVHPEIVANPDNRSIHIAEQVYQIIEALTMIDM